MLRSVSPHLDAGVAGGDELGDVPDHPQAARQHRGQDEVLPTFPVEVYGSLATGHR